MEVINKEQFQRKDFVTDEQVKQIQAKADKMIGEILKMKKKQPLTLKLVIKKIGWSLISTAMLALLVVFTGMTVRWLVWLFMLGYKLINW